MPINPSIALQVQPAQIENPLDSLAKVLSVKHLIAQQPLIDAQVKRADLENQQLTQQIGGTQALNDAYKSAVTMNPDGTPTIDKAAITNSLAKKGYGSQIPTVMEHFTKYETSLADLQKKKGEIELGERNALGSAALAAKGANYDPSTFAQALDLAAAHGYQTAAQLKQAILADPTKAKGLIDMAIQNSPEALKLVNEGTNAKGSSQRGQAAEDNAAREKAKADRQNAISGLIANPPANAAEYQQRVGALPPAIASEILGAVPAAAYDPAKSPNVINRLGMTPEQITQAARDAQSATDREANAAETRRHNLVDEQLSAGRLRVEKQRLAQTTGGLQLTPAQQAIAQKLASGDMNPASLTRFPDKEALITGAIAINPNWSTQTYATKRAFEDPQAKQSQNLGTISRIVGHIGRYEENSKALGFSPSMLTGGTYSGRAAATHEDAHAISAELEKLVSGGVGTEGQVKEWQKSLTSMNPTIRQQAVDEISRLVGSQYEGMNQTYKTTIGKDLPLEKYVSPAGREWMKAKGINNGGAAAAQATTAGVPTPTSQAEYNALSKGAQFKKPGDPQIYFKQ